MAKKIIIVLLLTIAFFQVSAVAIAGENMPGESVRLIAYYFHGSFRCATCHNLEKYAKESIENNFKDELDEGILVFKAVNVEEEGNEHFVYDYELYSKSLVLSLVKNGEEVEYKNLTKIWEYVSDRQVYEDYVKSEINAFLEEIQ